MTPKIIELKQAPVLLAEIPDHYRLYTRSDGSPFCTNIRNMSAKVIWQNDGEYIGILSDLTEEQFAECVDKYENSNPARYVNYTYKKPNGGMQVSRVTFPWRNKSSDSFYSLLESEKVYMENPYARPSYHDVDRNYWMLEDKWQEAQSRMIDPKRTVVLLRKDGVKCK